MITVSDALQKLRPDVPFKVDKFNNITWIVEIENKPTESEIQAKIAELEAAEPLRQLRMERNQLLTQTDWRMTTDYPYNDQAEWATYRTQLRNLPQTSNPTLDEQGNLIVDWPTAPDAV